MLLGKRPSRAAAIPQDQLDLSDLFGLNQTRLSTAAAQEDEKDDAFINLKGCSLQRYRKSLSDKCMNKSGETRGRKRHDFRQI